MTDEVTWVFCRAAGFVCDRCGAEQPMNLPVAYRYWNAVAGVFIEEHRECVAVPVPEPQP